MKNYLSKTLPLFLVLTFCWLNVNFAGFIAGTLVATSDGPVPIEQLRAGDRILSYTPDRKIAEVMIQEVLCHETDSLFCFTIESDRKIVASPHQQFFVKSFE